MREVNATFEAALAENSLKIAELFVLTLQNGDIYYFTSHSKNITWDVGGNIYVSLPIMRSEIRYSNNLESDEVDIVIANITTDFYDQISNNLLDGIQITIKRILWNSTYSADGEITLFTGIGEVTFNRQVVTLTCRPDYDRLNIKVPRHNFQEPCCHVLFDVGCGLTQSSYIYTGTATGGSKTTLEDSGRASIYRVDFDNGDSDNPLAAGDTLSISGKNNFGLDSDCVALWKLEEDALITDSIGSNYFSNVGTPTSELVDYKEGDGCASFDGSSALKIVDGDLDTDFPLKNGDTNKKISVSCWVKFNTLPVGGGTDFIISKWSSLPSSRSFCINIYETGGSVHFRMSLGYNSGSSSDGYPDLSFAVQTGVWYHVGATYQDSDQAYKMRVWDDTSQVTHDISGTASHAINVENAEFSLGRMYNGYYLYGLLDEVAVFKDVLTLDEIDAIRNGSYLKGLGTLTVVGIQYTTTSTGTIWFEGGSGEILDNSIMSSGGNSVQVNGELASEDYYYYQGELKITGGDNNGQRRMILNLEDGIVTVAWPFTYDVELGDTYELYPGCDKKPETCKDKFNNLANFKGFPYIPKVEETIM
jgi:hypothetical protein